MAQVTQTPKSRERKPLTIERLREVLHYDPQTGIWRWCIDRENGSKAGQIAGSLNGEGYRKIVIDGCGYISSRLAYFYMTDRWPPHQMDHKDLNRSNDRWSNIRPATYHQNARNRGLRFDNKCRLKGVSWHAQRCQWVAQIEGRYIGLFPTPELAHAAYAEAARARYGEFARIE